MAGAGPAGAEGERTIKILGHFAKVIAKVAAGDDVEAGVVRYPTLSVVDFYQTDLRLIGENSLRFGPADPAGRCARRAVGTGDVFVRRT